MATLQTALAQMTALWDAGDRRGALRMAAKWPRLGDHKEQIERGWSAISNPDFYRGLGKDPDALAQIGYDALQARYNLNL